MEKTRAKDRVQFNREVPQKTLLKLKALAERFDTTDAQALVKVIDLVASQEKITLFSNERAKTRLSAIPAYQLESLKALLEGRDADLVALNKLKTKLGKARLSDLKFREYVLFDLDIDASDFEVC